MNFENLYSKLPDFIKYNNSILNFAMKMPKKLANLHRKSNIQNSQHQLFELIFIHSEVKIKGTLRNIQLLYVELLRFIDNVCNKYDIDYWIDYGTLIGAVRHDGFIPWDDDIDLCIMRKDYEKLIEVLPMEISKFDYFKENCGLSLLRKNHENNFKDFKSVYDFEGNEDLLDSERFMFLQIAWLKPYVKIDFFPKDYILEDKLEYFKKNYLSTKYKFNQDIINGKREFDREFKIQNEKLGFTRDRTKYMCDALDTLQLTPVWIYETEKVFPLNSINFEGYEFRCPNDIGHCLEVIFGPNYMQLPEIIESHNIIPFIESQFNSKKEMDEKFKKDIEYLREINDNFKTG